MTSYTSINEDFEFHLSNNKRRQITTTSRFHSALKDLQQKQQKSFSDKIEGIFANYDDEGEGEHDGEDDEGSQYLTEFLNDTDNLFTQDYDLIEKEQTGHNNYNSYYDLSEEYDSCNTSIEMDQCYSKMITNSSFEIEKMNNYNDSRTNNNNNNNIYNNNNDNNHNNKDSDDDPQNEYNTSTVYVEHSQVIGRTKQKQNTENQSSKNINNTKNNNNTRSTESFDSQNKETNQNNEKHDSKHLNPKQPQSEASSESSANKRKATPITATSLKTSSVMQRTDALLSPLYRFWSILWNYGDENHPTAHLRSGGSKSSIRNGSNQSKKKLDSKSRTVMGSVVTGILRLSERFGRDAGKALSDQLKEPLDRLARSPITSTGEVIVVHTVDVESANVPKLMTVFGIFALALHIIKQYISLKFKKRQYRYLAQINQ